MTPHYRALTATAVAVSLLSGCSTLDGDKVDYRSATKSQPLSVPPDLTQISKSAPYAMVDGGVSASGLKAGQAAADKTPVSTTSIGDVRVERLGNQRWLVVKRPAPGLWDPVKSFWLDNGFVLAVDQPTLGIMETDWAENRAKIPLDAIRTALGKLFDNLYSVPERDKFRTRLETNAAGETEIYISHRGMAEVYTRERSDNTVWQPRPSDPELEIEFMRRLMVKLGSSETQVQAQLGKSPAPRQLATVSEAAGRPVLLMDDGFDRAWRRIGLALDRTGFTVEDRDRKQGIYFVRYVPAAEAQKEAGFLNRLFSSSKPADAAKFQILVQSQGEKSTVSVRDAQGQPDGSDSAKRIVKVLADDIR